ncbi:MAG: DUF1684 domain-containing protein, partial [Chloroflexota bacterium]
MTELTEFRNQKNIFFGDDPHSPLTHDQRHDFDGLAYFPENKALKLELEINKFEELEKIQMQTSTGDVQTYTRYGTVSFEVEDEQAQLTIFASDHGYFVPFVDSQAGKITYGAGRYLDPPILPSGELLL